MYSELLLLYIIIIIYIIYYYYFFTTTRRPQQINIFIPFLYVLLLNRFQYLFPTHKNQLRYFVRLYIRFFVLPRSY